MTSVKLRSLFLAGTLGYLGLYVYGLVMGVFAPWELVGFSVIALVFAVVYGVHAIRIHRAIRDDDDPLHDDVMRQTRHFRETRGF